MEDDIPNNNSGKTSKGRFAPGNTFGKGRPPGSRNKTTVALEKLMADDGKAVVAAVLKAAKGGDIHAARLILDRIVPARKGRAVAFQLPIISTPADILTALSAVVAAVGQGDLSPDEAAAIVALLESHRKTLEAVDLESRLAALEWSGR